MTLIQSKEGSTAYKKIDNVLQPYHWYLEFRNQLISRQEYLKQLLSFEEELQAAGLNEDQVHLSSRFSLDDEQTVDHILRGLFKRKMIPSITYPKAEFEQFAKRVNTDFSHGEYITYIFPEEARLLFALTYIMKPKKMVFLGSYYGYWAIWAVAVLKRFGGVAYLIDIDSKVITLAEENMKKFGISSLVNLINEDAITFMSREQIKHDFLVVDPEGPKIGDDPDLLDKAIYYPMVKTAYPYLSAEGMVLCHNILMNTPVSEDKYFEKKIAWNKQQFQKFLPFMQEHFYQGWSYETTEGVGIYLKNNLFLGG